MKTVTVPIQTSAYRLTWSTLVLAVVVLTSAFAIAGLALSSPVAHAATLVVDQCNGHGASAEGASTQMNCNVTIVNTISGTTTSSTTTVTRLCTLGPCSSPNGTFTTRSTSLVTVVRQCNGSDNDAAHPINCNVTITNNISANTPGAQPATAATVNQCVGSGGGGGGSVNCDPFPATTTGATVTQCNGSANGGGGTIACSVGTASTVRPAIPITINQCNGTGNPGGSVVTCRASLINNITAAVVGAATPSPQVTRVPTGAVASGDGSTSGGAGDAQGPFAGALLLAGIGGVAVVAACRRRRQNI